MPGIKRVSQRPARTIWVQTPEVAVSAAAVYPLYSPVGMDAIFGSSATNRGYIIKTIQVVYITATDANSTNNIRIGNQGNSSAHHDFSTPTGKTAGTIDIIDQSNFSSEPRTFIDSEVWTQVRFVGGAGAGTVIVRLELSFDYTQWVGYSPQVPA